MDNGAPAAARRAGLVYLSYGGPGIARVRAGKSFAYRLPGGGRVRSKAMVARLKKLAIPPAWTKVWICPKANGHIQATGFDARGRRQYLYHADWTSHRNEAKFETLYEFARALSALRARVSRDLSLPGLPREKVAACIVRLMDRTLIRVGNSEYSRDNQSYGLTTMLNRHARVSGGTITFKFKGKSGKLCETEIESARAAKIVRVCQDLPGQELFCYRDENGRVRDIGSADVNAYLKEVTGKAFTAKDFRTWGGTCAAAAALRECECSPEMTERELKEAEMRAIRAAAEALGNTVAVCRKFYVHGCLMGAFQSGKLREAFGRAGKGRGRLSACERATMALLRAANGRKTRER